MHATISLHCIMFWKLIFTQQRTSCMRWIVQQCEWKSNIDFQQLNRDSSYLVQSIWCCEWYERCPACLYMNISLSLKVINKSKWACMGVSLKLWPHCFVLHLQSHVAEQTPIPDGGNLTILQDWEQAGLLPPNMVH